MEMIANEGVVRNHRLIDKLDSYGIKDNILNWIHAFLSRHTQVVKVNGAESTTAQVLSRIPRESVLGPILFVIYISMISLQILNLKDFFWPQADVDGLNRWSRMSPQQMPCSNRRKIRKHKTHQLLQHIWKRTRLRDNDRLGTKL